MKKLLLALGFLSLSSLSLADDMQFSLSSDMVEAAYQSNLGKNYNAKFKNGQSPNAATGTKLFLH